MNKPKRKTNKLYSATKLVTKNGTLRYLSEIKRSRMKNKQYKDPDASFWADWKPLRKLGVFANESRIQLHRTTALRGTCEP